MPKIYPDNDLGVLKKGKSMKTVKILDKNR